MPVGVTDLNLSGEVFNDAYVVNKTNNDCNKKGDQVKIQGGDQLNNR